MATINVVGGSSFTGTAADDIFNDAENVAGLEETGMGMGTDIDGGEGSDTVNFGTALTGLSTDGDTVTVAIPDTGNNTDHDDDDNDDDDDITLQNVETLVFTNGTIDLTNDDDLQYLIDTTGTMGNTFNAGTVLVYNPDDEAVSPMDATVASINGQAIEESEAVEIEGQGTVTLNGTELVFTPFTNYAQSLGLGETGDVSFDVTFMVGEEEVTVTYTTSVEGEASDDADVYRTNLIDGDQDEAIDGLGGDDTLVGDEGADTINGGDGDDRIFAGANDTADLGDDDDDEDDSDIDNFSDAFAGGAGDDIVAGGVGDDILTGDDDSRVTEGEFDAARDGSDTIFGGAGDDEIHTGSWADSDQGLGDTQTGSASDVAYGGEGDDRIAAAGGNDTLGGGNGDDSITGAGGNDVIYGGEDDGEDSLVGGAGNDTIFGGDGVDTVEGGVDDDLLFNGGGDDEVFGGSGQDTLWGGEGDDELTGDADSDVFAFEEGNGVDTITDFEDGVDKIDLSELGMTADDLPNMIGAIDGETAIFYGDGDAIIVENVDAADLTADDFIF